MPKDHRADVRCDGHLAKPRRRRKNHPQPARPRPALAPNTDPPARVPAQHSSNLLISLEKWCPGAESNHRHADFQSAALPTELPGHGRRSPAGRSAEDRREPARKRVGYSTSLIPVQRRRRENSQAGTKPFLKARRRRRTQAGQWRASGRGGAHPGAGGRASGRRRARIRARGARRITETARGPGKRATPRRHDAPRTTPGTLKTSVDGPGAPQEGPSSPSPEMSAGSPGMT